MRGSKVRIVDDAGRVVPPGFVGEISIGGSGVAVGYLNRPEETADRFVVDSSGGRWYRTGDRGRIDRDGLVHFLGRVDGQRKLRGYRIELGEIEAVLDGHPAVAESLVGLDPADADRLVACVVSDGSNTQLGVDAQELAAHVRSSLPGYMVPSIWLPVEVLPRTANGKPDRDLAAVADLLSHRAPAEAPTPPRTQTEQRLAAVWQRVLLLPTAPGVHDNFFDLGGHSLLAAQLVFEIEQDLSLELPLAAIFRLDTVALMAATLQSENPTISPPAEVSPAVIVIDHRVPVRDRDSGSRRLDWLLRLMAESHDRVVMVPVDGMLPEPYISELERAGVEVTSPALAGGSDWLDAMFAVAEVVWICKPEVFEQFAPRVRSAGPARLVYDTVDLHHVRLRRAARFARRQQSTWREVRDRELQAASAADVTVTVTADEKGVLERNDVGSVMVVPNVHVARTSRPPPFADRSGLLFVGSYDHAPNVDAAVWLCESIMPRVWKRDRSITLTLLGNRPNAIVRGLASDRVDVPGYVEDLEPWFDRHRVFVARLQYGAGMKGKVGQAFEHSLPIVSTPIGIEGFDLDHETDVLVAAGSAAFARAVLRLHRDAQLWEQMASGYPEHIAAFSPAATRSRLASVIANPTRQR